MHAGTRPATNHRQHGLGLGQWVLAGYVSNQGGHSDVLKTSQWVGLVKAASAANAVDSIELKSVVLMFVSSSG